MSSCKYEDGPGISLRSREKRVSGRYDIINYSVAGINLTDSLKQAICFKKIEFTKDGEIIFSPITSTCNPSGRWGFRHKDERIAIRFYGADTLVEPIGSNFFLIWNITRLTNDELTINVNYKNQFVELKLKE